MTFKFTQKRMYFQVVCLI